MLNKFELGIIALVKSALTGKPAAICEDFDFEKAYELAKSHRIIPLIYYGIVNSGITVSPELNNKYFTATVQSLAVSEKQKASMARLCDEFEKAGIDFMPLKGTIIREIYAKQEMRSMGDADVLIHYEQYEKMVPILENMGMTFVKENENELAWNDHPFYLELHRYLVSPQHKDYYRYFGDGWRFAKPSCEGSHRYVMSDEDYYVYLFAHFTKHYRFSGIGIKHLTDIWVYLGAKPQLDMDYVNEAFEKLGMRIFHDNVLNAVKCWFEDKEYDNITEIITQKILGSGAFGTHESSIKANAVKEKQNSDGNSANIQRSKLLTVLFLPYSRMCEIYPVLKKLPILLPFMWIWRGIKTVLFKKGTVQRQLNDIKSVSSENIAEYENELKAVGLDYDFGE